MSPRIQPLTPERARTLATDPARQRLLDLIANATTCEEIDTAWQAQRAWLIANPDDIGVLEAGEDLAHAEESLAVGESTLDSTDVATKGVPGSALR
jgi:hypothetical protein